MSTKLTISFLLAVAIIGCKKPAPPKLSPALPALAQIVATPKTSARSTTPGADATIYAYPDQSGLRDVRLAVSKERPSGWALTFGGDELSPFNFTSEAAASRNSGGVDLPAEWWEIGDGPLKGNVVFVSGWYTSQKVRTAMIYSPTYFLSKAYIAQTEKSTQVMQWACDSGRGGVKAPMTTANFLKSCRDSVTAKGGSPGLASGFSQDNVLTAADCSHVLLGSNFKCSQSRGSVAAEVF